MTDMNEKKLKKLVKESKSFSDVSRKLYDNNFYGNRQTIKKYVKQWDISVSHFVRVTNKTNRNLYNSRPLSEIMVENSNFDTTHLKNRLYKENVKKRICEKCGQNEYWYGEKMSLILDHINGISNDHRLKNLRILCPNCNSTLPTHGGRNVKQQK
jgi:hypothetical protein